MEHSQRQANLIEERKLTEEQRDLVVFICRCFQEKKALAIVVNSPGGTGKTHVIVTLSLMFGKDVNVVTPTHKAKSILNNEIDRCCQSGSRVQTNRAQTFHRFFHAKQEYTESGKVIFVFPKEIGAQDPDECFDEDDYEDDCVTESAQPISAQSTAQESKDTKFQILIADECSMIPTPIMNVFAEKIKTQPGIYIFMGDAKQLPPVGENDSPVFTKPYYKYAFTRNMRVKSNPDLGLTISFFREPFTKHGVFAKFGTPQSLEQTIDDMSDRKVLRDSVYLTFTNRKKNMVNNMLRSILFGQEDGQSRGIIDRFEVGEILYFSGYRNHKIECIYSKYGCDGLCKDVSYDGQGEKMTHTSNEPKLDHKKDIRILPAVIETLLILERHKCLNTCNASFYSSDLIQVLRKDKITIQFAFSRNPIHFLRLVICKPEIESFEPSSINPAEQKSDGNQYVWIVPATSEDETALLKYFSLWEKKTRAMKVSLAASKTAGGDGEIQRRQSKQILTEWYNYWFLKKILLPDLDYTYAMTIHKAQGSQWKNVYVDIGNLFWPEHSTKLIYTGVSRAMSRVVFSN